MRYGLGVLATSVQGFLHRTGIAPQALFDPTGRRLETATQALRSGAYDYLVKPFDDLDAISAVAQRAAEKVELLETVDAVRRFLDHQSRP